MTNLRHALALGLGASAITLLPTSTAHAASTCQGLPATIEASSGDVTGTSGNDVIVVSGDVMTVYAGDGDDTVCLVDTTKIPGRNRDIYVDSGAGDDVVDASAAGAGTSVRLGPGADSFVGSAFEDSVQVGTVGASLDEPGDPGPYDVATGTGKDFLSVDFGAVVTADLGGGADGLALRSVEGTPGSHVDLGPGRDGAYFEDIDWEQEGAGETTLRVDLTRDLMEWHGVTSVVLGAEDIHGVARRIRVRGDAGPNSFSSFGCDVTFRGGAGDDTALMRTVRAAERQPFTCKRGEVRRALGNAGDDFLRGGRSHDVLIGGPGRDKAHGGPSGDDVCIAEIIAGKGCRD